MNVDGRAVLAPARSFTTQKAVECASEAKWGKARAAAGAAGSGGGTLIEFGWAHLENNLFFSHHMVRTAPA